MLGDMIEAAIHDQFETLGSFDVHFFKSVIYRSLGDREIALSESRISLDLTVKFFRSSVVINTGFKVLLPLFHNACCFLQYRQLDDLEDALKNMAYCAKTYKLAATAEKIFQEEIQRIQETEGPIPYKRKHEGEVHLKSEIEYLRDFPAFPPVNSNFPSFSNSSLNSSSNSSNSSSNSSSSSSNLSSNSSSSSNSSNPFIMAPCSANPNQFQNFLFGFFSVNGQSSASDIEHVLPTSRPEPHQLEVIEDIFGLPSRMKNELPHQQNGYKGHSTSLPNESSSSPINYSNLSPNASPQSPSPSQTQPAASNSFSSSPFTSSVANPQPAQPQLNSNFTPSFQPGFNPMNFIPNLFQFPENIQDLTEMNGNFDWDSIMEGVS